MLRATNDMVRRFEPHRAVSATEPERQKMQNDEFAAGSYLTINGRIMSCSSCSRMWQCHTYSWPPVLGLIGSPMDDGSFGRVNFVMTVVASPGFIRTVSFHPVSFASGGIGGPVNF